jgi:hypothetical protein
MSYRQQLHDISVLVDRNQWDYNLYQVDDRLNLYNFTSQKSYMQMAIEYGANGVITALLKDGDTNEKALKAVPYLLSEEKRTLICEKDEKAQNKKMFQLMAIASAIVSTGAEIKQALGNAHIKTPIVKYLQSCQTQMS